MTSSATGTWRIAISLAFLLAICFNVGCSKKINHDPGDGRNSIDEYDERNGTLHASLPRVRHVEKSPCRIRMVSPMDLGVINFTVGHNITLSVQLECFEEKLAEWEKENPDVNFHIGFQLDGAELVTFVANPRQICCPLRTWSYHMLVTQWYDSNVVLKGQKTHDSQLDVSESSRTVSIAEKHLFHASLRMPNKDKEEEKGDEDEEKKDGENSEEKTREGENKEEENKEVEKKGEDKNDEEKEEKKDNILLSVANLPFFLEPFRIFEHGLELISPPHGSRQAQGEPIHLLARLDPSITHPTVLSVRLHINGKKAVRVFPEWKLPDLHSGRHETLLHVTVAFNPPWGKYPVRIEFMDPRKGLVASLSTHFDVVHHTEVHKPYVRYAPPHMEDLVQFNAPEGWWETHEIKHNEEEEEDEGDSMAGGGGEADGGRRERSMFCSRRDALNYGTTLSEWNAHRGDLHYRIHSYKDAITPKGEEDGSVMLLDLGGYKGVWSSQMLSMCAGACTVHVYEPVESYAAEAEKRLAAFPAGNFKVHRSAVAGSKGEGRVIIQGPSSRLSTEGGQETPVLAAGDILKGLGVDSVAVAKINVEGSEYEILEALAEEKLLPMLDNVQVQFHEANEGDSERRRGLQGVLNQTHCLTYSFPFLWENWRVRNTAKEEWKKDAASLLGAK